tara:strand:+ start:2293 stop:2448 length:156 start_codon:yes stop_codon:yes gene_type:complete
LCRAADIIEKETRAAERTQKGDGEGNKKSVVEELLDGDDFSQAIYARCDVV